MQDKDRDRLWTEWMGLARKGDEAAYHRLLTALAPVLRAAARQGFARLGGGNSEVEDIVQETLLAIHLKRHTWREGEPLLPWVRAICRNKVIDAMRRQGRLKATPLDDVIGLLELPEPEPPPREIDPAVLLKDLPDKQRSIVEAVSLEGLSTREAAQRFSMSEGALRVALHRALKSLAALYRAREGEGRA